VYFDSRNAVYQWSFRKIGTTGTLASQAEKNGVWVQATGSRLLGVRGYYPEKIEIVCKIRQYSAFLTENSS